MKNLTFVFICLLSFNLFGQEKDLIVADDDSVVYEITIMDPGFDTWLISRAKPKEFYSQSYYENWNKRYVIEWNYRYSSAKNTKHIQSYINYNNTVDYGLELNYKLYNYFLFFEETTGILLISRRGN